MPGLPEGYTGLVMANTRRACQWQEALQAMGIEAVRVPSAGRHRERGSWQIGVPEADAPRARALVRHVIEGHAHLPAPPLLLAGARTRLAIGVTLLMLAAAAITLGF